MNDSMQQRLLDEFGGLFERGGGWTASASGDESDLANPVREAVEEPGGTASGSSGAVGVDAAVESGGSSRGAADAAAALDETVRVLTQLESSGAPAAATSAGVNVHSNPANESASGGSSTSIESIATTFLESGFGIVPLISGLIGLFGGSGSESAPAFEKYLMPQAISFESAETGDGLAAADFDQTGAPRVYAPGTSIPGEPGPGSPGAAPNVAGVAGSTAAPQITVNVQAMDAQSFMDYSSQIAQAVRSAMLNLSSLNDVVSEL